MIKKTIKAIGILVGVLAVVIAAVFIYQASASASEERSYASSNGTNESVIDEVKAETGDNTKEETKVEETTAAKTLTTNTTTNSGTGTQSVESTPVVETPQYVYVAPQAGVPLNDIQGQTVASQNSAIYSAQINEMFNIINQRRAENGLGALQLDWSLIQVASFRAAEMAHLDNGSSQISHTRPNGTRFSTVAQIYGVGYSVIGENICDVLSTPSSAMNGFMNSPGHKANILGNYTSVGIGVAQASDGTFYWAQIFTI